MHPMVQTAPEAINTLWNKPESPEGSATHLENNVVEIILCLFPE